VAIATESLDVESQSLFNKATAAIKADAPSEALAALEQIADRGVLHPEVSYDRAIAYIKRAHSQRAQAGDLGRAAAALEEIARASARGRLKQRQRSPPYTLSYHANAVARGRRVCWSAPHSAARWCGCCLRIFGSLRHSGRQFSARSDCLRHGSPARLAGVSSAG
jgi:hypothetical protein